MIVCFKYTRNIAERSVFERRRPALILLDLVGYHAVADIADVRLQHRRSKCGCLKELFMSNTVHSLM